MYSEEAFKNYIFWLKVKRVFFILVFSVVGCLLGLLLAHVVIEILKFNSALKIVFVGAGTLVFFALSLLITANTGKEVQDGYWKIAVLRKLTVISKKLDRITVIEPNQTVQGDVAKATKETPRQQVKQIKEVKEVKKAVEEVTKTAAQVILEAENLDDVPSFTHEDEKVDMKEADKADKKMVKEEDIKEDIEDVYPKIPTIRDDLNN